MVPEGTWKTNTLRMFVLRCMTPPAAGACGSEPDIDVPDSGARLAVTSTNDLRITILVPRTADLRSA